VQVRKASDNSVISGASGSVNGTIATITVPFTETIEIVVVALGNASGRESEASSPAQTLLVMYNKPIISESINYATVGAGSYTASMTYTVVSGVTAVSVFNSASGVSLPSGASVTSNSVIGTTASLVVSFTDAVLPLSVVVVAQGNANGRQSEASMSQLLMLPPPEVTAGTVSSAISFKSTFGSTGASNTQFNAPQGVAVDANDNIYVADDTNNRIKKFDKTGTWISTIGDGSYSTADGQFRGVSDVTIDSIGNVYVADVNNHRIQVFNSSGTFLRKFGSNGTGDGQFQCPAGIALDKSGNIYVVDLFNHRVQVFDNNGNFLRKFGSLGSSLGQFNNTSGIAVDSNGQIYVADKNNNRIQIFNNAGTTVIRSIACPSPPKHLAVDGAGNIVVAVTDAVVIYDSLGVLKKTITGSANDGQFYNAYGVAIDSTGRLIVTSNNVGRVVILDVIPPPELNAGTIIPSTISFKSTFGSTGASNTQFNAPQGVAVDANDNIYVADDHVNNRIKKFDKTGTWISTIGNGSYSTADGQFRGVSDVTIDSIGNMYVADVNNHRIQVFNSSGTLISKFGSNGTGDGQFQCPAGIALDKSGNIYVVDLFNHRVQVFDNNGNFLRKFGSLGSSLGQFNNTAGIAVDSNGQIYVADNNNNRIQIFNNAGTTSTAITCPSPPKHVAIDGAGNIVVAVTDAVVIYNSLGVVQKTITGDANNGQFYNPYGVAIDSTGRLVVTSKNVSRVVILGS